MQMNSIKWRYKWLPHWKKEARFPIAHFSISNLQMYFVLWNLLSTDCNMYRVTLLFSHQVTSNSATPWTAARQASLSFTLSQSLLKLFSIESGKPSSQLILCHPLHFSKIIHWNSNTLATSCEELTHWKRPWCWEGLGAGGEGDDRGWYGWMALLTRWT